MVNVNLMKGDCLERMKEIPDGSVDLILTDPPYNIAKSNNFHTMGRTGIDFGEWDKGFDLFTYINGLSRICKKMQTLSFLMIGKTLAKLQSMQSL